MAPNLPTRRIREFIACAGVMAMALGLPDAEAFTVSPVRYHQAKSFRHMALFAAPGKRQPRRNLKKRRSRREKDKYRFEQPEDFSRGDSEIRPLIASQAIEAGQDYWIDEEDLAKSKERERAIKNRKAMEGEIPQEKLRKEVTAPYEQNWIGLISVTIIVLATIVTKFPELLNQPVIQIPDL